jgi:hypothetical protein
MMALLPPVPIRIRLTCPRFEEQAKYGDPDQRSDNGIAAHHSSASWLYVARANIRNTQKKYLPYPGGNAKQGATAGAIFARGGGGLAFWPVCQGKHSVHGNPTDGRPTLKRDASQPNPVDRE